MAASTPTPAPPVRPHLTIREAAEILGVTRITVGRWIANGDLPATRIGPRLVRIRREDVENVGRPVVPPGGAR